MSPRWIRGRGIRPRGLVSFTNISRFPRNASVFHGKGPKNTRFFRPRGTIRAQERKRKAARITSSAGSCSPENRRTDSSTESTVFCAVESAALTTSCACCSYGFISIPPLQSPSSTWRHTCRPELPPGNPCPNRSAVDQSAPTMEATIYRPGTGTTASL